jgi:hypothetical protein
MLPSNPEDGRLHISNGRSLRSHMVLNNYIIYKGNIRAGSKPVLRLDHTVTIANALGEEWLQENSATKISCTIMKKPQRTICKEGFLCVHVYMHACISSSKQGDLVQAGTFSS